jgi:hypothetical protein
MARDIPVHNKLSGWSLTLIFDFFYLKDIIRMDEKKSVTWVTVRRDGLPPHLFKKRLSHPNRMNFRILIGRSILEEEFRPDRNHP